MRKSGITFDLVIKDVKNIMILLCVMSKVIYGETTNIIKSYLNLKFKMKISYDLWFQEKNIGQLLRDAIERTLEERMKVARHKL